MKLDLNCNVALFNSFLKNAEAIELYNELLTNSKLTTKFSLLIENGERFEEDYKKMMFIDQNLFGENRFPKSIWGENQVWSPKMKLVKDRIESFTGFSFETCVCIYYPDGSTGVDYHSDYPAFGDTTHIASISIGEERIFLLREKKTQKVDEILLKNGSLLIMGEGCQDKYEHALPLDSNCKKPRINLTFRKYGFNNL
ncbi:alpha-ketoglutarate-dependent dioxygenase AlkB [Polaribacter sp. Hel1_85]|uniref:alpha-ketoglutarate-dependent dioxygenase AlkB n=1 Tax=Polaribacter sp. Hel1_85 TaxID=1250005 RepID=UPI00052BFBFF|nr:alpha-ketoglutarate-dependent dioxygenase AlkB [Polaribacter sp. Hel1_85]KGL63803.1 DNA repair protein [Polaribacter sp. Hel1_85]